MLKKIIIGSILLAMTSISASAQKPEFTVRSTAGFYSSSIMGTAGVRLNEKRTVGVLAGRNSIYYDSVPAHTYSVDAALYYRRYIPLGQKGLFSLYSDIYAGASVVYKVTGSAENVSDGDPYNQDKRGDIAPLLGWQPGIRICPFRNVHLFLGPTISTEHLGLHIGVGF